METADFFTGKSTIFNCIFSSNVIPLHFLYSATLQIEIEAQFIKVFTVIFVDFYCTLTVNICSALDYYHIRVGGEIFFSTIEKQKMPRKSLILSRI